MRYFTSDTHFGHPLVTALRGFLNNGRLRAEYRDVWQAQGRAAAHTWIKQYVRDNQTSFKAICDITRHENTIIGNINETVGRDDELWILGDLSYRCTVEHTLDCLRRINCRHLHLIIGNHDRTSASDSMTYYTKTCSRPSMTTAKSTWNFPSSMNPAK